MAYSLVGSAGAVTVGTAGAAVTPAWDAGASRTAGDLLVCLIAGWGGTTLPATPTGGWNSGANNNPGGQIVQVFFLEATGSNAAPTVAAATGMTWAAQLLEFSGNKTGLGFQLEDRRGGSSTAFSPVASACGFADETAGSLVVWIVAEGSIVITGTLAEHTGSPNNGMTANNMDNNSTSTANHYLFGWGITTGNSVADSNTIDFDQAAGDTVVTGIMSFKVAPLTRALTGTLSLAQSLVAQVALAWSPQSNLRATMRARRY